MSTYPATPSSSSWPLAGLERYFPAGYLGQGDNTTFDTVLRIVVTLVAIPAVAIFVNVVQQLAIPRRASTPPVVFHWLPFVGSAIAYGNDPLKFLFQCREKYGDVFTFILLGRRITVALGPKGNNFVLGGKSVVFNAEDAYAPFTTPVFGKDVIYDVPNERFMEQKRFVKAGLSTANLRAYVGMIEQEVNDVFAKDPAFNQPAPTSALPTPPPTPASKSGVKWEGQFDAVKTMQEITILTASRTLQGKEVRENLDKGYAKLYNDLDGGFTPVHMMFPYLPLESSRKRDRAQKKMSQFYMDIIRGRAEKGSVSDGEDGHDMIATFLEQQYRSGESLKEHEIANMMIVLLMAGQHTSSATGSWALLHLANNPDVAEALYKEQVQHFGTVDSDGKTNLRPMTLEELRALPVLDSVIRETLRMHPPIHCIMRYVREDVLVQPNFSSTTSDGSYVIPKGHYVMASPVISQMDPAIWKSPQKWDLTRWTDPQGVAAQAFKEYLDENGERVDFGFGKVSKGTESPYQPFGAGRHRCIGEQFAYLQLGTILATVVRNVELWIEKIPEPDYHTLITMPKEPRMVSYRRRK
ncbi:hypothetical protein H1R20_g2425, partial [Candolleomyces eurysporus]